ncbi:acetyl-CoA carboxylase carboxyltransferase subunit beta [Pelagibacteraceae bacterium]|nr:acetyl-CoA carboxylase carboxyltransferase subunit beta [Pelagibacteraceae bacterium]
MNWITKFLKPKIKSIFKKRSSEEKDTLWTNCSCGKLTLKEEFVSNLYVCPSCDKHHTISNKKRFSIFFDNEYEILEHGVPEENPINFKDTKDYELRIQEARAKTKENESMLAATGKVNGIDVTVASMSFHYMGGSVSPYVGECFLSAVQHCITNRQPLILMATSGGMRMQTGILSLQQMARMTLGCSELKKNKLPFICLATGHVLGGTTASFASLADIIYSESKDFLWGFSGKRIIEQNLREKLADEVQTSQWVYEHGQIDKIVSRKEIKSEISNILSILLKIKEKENINSDNVAIDKSIQAAI